MEKPFERTSRIIKRMGRAVEKIRMRITAVISEPW
jgi:hypothetical protein